MNVQDLFWKHGQELGGSRMGKGSDPIHSGIGQVFGQLGNCRRQGGTCFGVTSPPAPIPPGEEARLLIPQPFSCHQLRPLAGALQGSSRGGTQRPH